MVKKNYLACAFAAFVCGTSGLSAGSMNLHSYDSMGKSATLSSDSLTAGVSIGTVSVSNYAESGLSFDYFDNVSYVAQVSEGTYLGFGLFNIFDDDGLPTIPWAAGLMAVNSTEENVVIPDSIFVAEEGVTYPVSYIMDGDYVSLASCFSNGVTKTLTVPKTVTQFYNTFDQYLTGLYMLGNAPSVLGNVAVPNIYICNRDSYVTYLSNPYFAQGNLIPYGWSFDDPVEWTEVVVEKPGEFAETFLTQNDYDWNNGVNVKVIGDINATDLMVMGENMGLLMNLDLSETSVTSLPEQFMYGHYYLQSVNLSATVETIGYGAFQDCSSLYIINLENVKNIDEYAFYNCTSISDVDLSAVETIGERAFAECISISDVNLSVVETIGERAFAGCSALTVIDFGMLSVLEDYICDGCTSLERVVLSPSVTSIGNYAFSDCHSLRDVEFPASVLSSLSIGADAFYNCKYLNTVSLPEGTVSVESDAFSGCISLAEVSLPSTLKSIGSDVFFGTALSNVICRAVVPPVAVNAFVEEVDLSHTVLYVPACSKDTYRNTAYWNDFFLMQELDEPVNYIYVDRPFTLNLQEEFNYVMDGRPVVELSFDKDTWGVSNIGQLTSEGDGTLSAGEFKVNGQLGSNPHRNNTCPTFINRANKVRADSVVNTFTFYYDKDWCFVSLPYDVKVSDIVPGSGTYWAIRRYDGEARANGGTTWVDLTEDDVMEAGKGYIISATATNDIEGSYGVPVLTFSSGNSTTKNNIFVNTDVIVPLEEHLSEFAHNRSWNLVGNPYPAYYDLSCLRDGFTAPLTVWDGSGYLAVSPLDDYYVLAPYQAFFVQRPLDHENMVFGEEGRMHYDDYSSMSYAKAFAVGEADVTGRNVFNFNVTGNDASDRARVVLNPEASAGYELDRDAAKFFSSSDVEIYVSSEDVAYSICERPVADSTAVLGIRSSKEGTYTLSLDGRHSDEWSVLLTDRVQGGTVNLAEQDYVFTAGEKDEPSRFSVRFVLGDDTKGLEQAMAGFGPDADAVVTAMDGTVVYKGRFGDVMVPVRGIYIVSVGGKNYKVVLDR